MFLSGVVQGFNRVVNSPQLNNPVSLASTKGWQQKIIMTMIAIVILLVVGLIAFIVYYSFSVKYVRPFFINAPQDFSAIIQDVYTSLNTTYQTYVSSGVKIHIPVEIPKTLAFIEMTIKVQPLESTQPVRPQYIGERAPSKEFGGLPDECLTDEYKRKRDANELTSIEVFVPDVKVDMQNDPKCAPRVHVTTEFPVRKRNETVLELYLYYDNILRSKIDAWIYKEILQEYRQYSSSGSDNDAGLEFIRENVQIVRDVQEELTAAMKTLSEFEKTPFDKGIAANITEVCVCLHRMHFLLVLQSDMLKDMADSRRFSLLNFLVITMRPLTKVMLVDEIFARFKQIFIPSEMEKTWRDCRNFWVGVGETIDSIPTHMREIVADVGSGTK
jgi:hypothetical protein